MGLFLFVGSAIGLLIDIVLSSVFSEPLFADLIDLLAWSAQELEQLWILFELPDLETQRIQAVSFGRWSLSGCVRVVLCRCPG